MIALVFPYFFLAFFGLFFEFFFLIFPLRFGIMASVRQPLGKIRHIPCSRVRYYHQKPAYKIYYGIFWVLDRQGKKLVRELLKHMICRLQWNIQLPDAVCSGNASRLFFLERMSDVVMSATTSEVAVLPHVSSDNARFFKPGFCLTVKPSHFQK